MCGIVGFIDNELNKEEQEKIINKMLISIEHRGNDCSKTFIRNKTVLGHRRLSIIDISESSNQPFLFNDLVLVYNGEIYNYIEIKEELVQLGHIF